MRRATILAVAAVLAVAAGASASDPVGIYALIDSVVLEPKEGKPERIQVWGVFVLSTNRGVQHSEPMRGYMYFTIVPGKEEVCRREWADLKRTAGSDAVVAFGSSYVSPAAVRKARTQAKPAAPMDAPRIRALIADLGSDQFDTREKATRELEEQGAHAHGELRKALEGDPSPEARRRIAKLLPTEKPDLYQLGFGLTKLEGRHGEQRRNHLRSLPEPLAPAEGSIAATGKVTLRTRRITGSDHSKAGYVFEMDDPAGGKEASPIVTASKGDTVEWSPRLEIQPGKRYVWRVRAVDGEWKGPVAETAFRGKAAQ